MRTNFPGSALKFGAPLGSLALCALALALTPLSYAAVIWSGPVNITIPSTTTGVYLDVVTGVHSTDAVFPADLHAFLTGPLLSFDSDFDFPNGNAYVSRIADQGGVNNVPEAFQIGPSQLNWSQDTITTDVGQTTSPYWTPNSTNNLVGFRFDNEVTSQVHYGWARISLSADYQSQPMSIVAYAYESVPNTAILAGAVPEPATTGLLGLGALALVVRGSRRRR